MSLSDLFRKPKDALISNVIKPLVQTKLNPYGNMTKLSINSADKSIHLSLDLKGESSPIEIHVRDYEVVRDGGNNAIRLGAIETSREWMTQLIKAYLPENKKTIPIPPAAAAAASVLL
jgi:hypothetical protein